MRSPSPWSNVQKIAAGLVAFVPALRSIAADTRHPRGIASLPKGSVQIAVRRQGEFAYAAGQIAAIEDDSITLSSTASTAPALVLTSDSQVWKGSWFSILPMELGDEVVAWGARASSGSIAVQQMLVNYVSLVGTVFSLRATEFGSEFVHQSWDGEETLVYSEQITLMNEYFWHGLCHADRSTRLQVGHFAHVIGLRLWDGSVRAIQIFF